MMMAFHFRSLRGFLRVQQHSRGDHAPKWSDMRGSSSELEAPSWVLVSVFVAAVLVSYEGTLAAKNGNDEKVISCPITSAKKNFDLNQASALCVILVHFFVHNS
jgi:hypothetical protein